MTRAIPQAAFDIAKDKEKLVLFAYDDAHYPPREAVPGNDIVGTLTAGYGHTGEDVHIGMVVTEDMADAWLEQNLETAFRLLQTKVGEAIIADLSDNQLAAMIDFVLNLGTGNPAKPEWTIWKRLRERAYSQVPGEIAKFVNVTRKDGTVVKLNGLVDRRNAEIGLWAVDEKGTEDVNPSSSVTRSMATPPTPADPVPLSKSKSLWGTIGGAAAVAYPVFDQVKDMADSLSGKLAPYAHHSNAVQTTLGILSAVGAVCIGFGVVYTVIQKHNARN